MQEKIATILLFNGFCLILKVYEAAFDLVPHGEVVHVVEGDEGVESENENLKIYQRW